LTAGQKTICPWGRVMRAAARDRVLKPGGWEGAVTAVTAVTAGLSPKSGRPWAMKGVPCLPFLFQSVRCRKAGCSCRKAGCVLCRKAGCNRGCRRAGNPCRAEIVEREACDSLRYTAPRRRSHWQPAFIMIMKMKLVSVLQRTGSKRD
jgi:hypothetical protein